MTAWSLGLMNIAKCWVSSFKKLCQALTAAAFNYCLFVDISAFNFIFSKEKIYILNWVRVSGVCHFISFPCLSFPLWLLSLFSASSHLSCTAAFDWTENMLWTPPCIVDVAISKISLCKIIWGRGVRLITAFFPRIVTFLNLILRSLMNSYQMQQLKSTQNHSPL